MYESKCESSIWFFFPKCIKVKAWLLIWDRENNNEEFEGSKMELWRNQSKIKSSEKSSKAAGDAGSNPTMDSFKSL